MNSYYINKVKTDGRYNEIHISTCPYKPTVNAVYLGLFNTYSEAKSKAISLGYNPDGCGHCIPRGHNG